MDCPFLRTLLLVRVAFILAHSSPVLVELDQKLELSERTTTTMDAILTHLCQILPSKAFIQAANDDEEFLSSILYRLGFGVLSIRRDSWAEKYRAHPHKTVSCFASLYDAATTEVSKSSLGTARRILRRCCKDTNDV